MTKQSSIEDISKELEGENYQKENINLVVNLIAETEKNFVPLHDQEKIHFIQNAEKVSDLKKMDTSFIHDCNEVIFSKLFRYEVEVSNFAKEILFARTVITDDDSEDFL